MSALSLDLRSMTGGRAPVAPPASGPVGTNWVPPTMSPGIPTWPHHHISPHQQHQAWRFYADLWKQSIRPAPLEEIPQLQLAQKEARGHSGQEGQGHSNSSQGQVQGQGRMETNNNSNNNHKTTSSVTSSVATVTTTSSTMTKNRTSKTPSPSSQPAVSPSVKSIPVHCIVDQSAGSEPTVHNGADLAIEMDTYAILPSNTPFNDIVRTALTKIGYTTAEAVGAKGLIQIKNWKPLTFDSVTENPDSSVEEILGELTSVATLRIKLSSNERQHSVEEVKEKLLQFLLQHSQNILTSSGCPIEKHLLGLLSKGEYPGMIPDEIRNSFNRWYNEQTKGNEKDGGKDMPPHLAYPALRSELINTPNSGYKTTRIRTSFDPDLEIPRLQQWFQQNQHPSREQMQTFLNELNTLESRRDRKPLDLANIIYWFKNARAAVRRQSRSNEGGDDQSINEDTLDENLSTGTPEENMPVLPNRNAVYVVSDPLHHWATGKTLKQEDCGSPVLQIMPQSPEEEEKDDDDEGKEKRTHSVMNGDSERVMEADGKENICENLPKRARLDSEGSEDGDVEVGHDLSLKKERMEEEDYDSSSNSSPSTPRPASLPSSSAGGMTLATTLSQPPPPAHQTLNMTVLPNALNMHYMHGGGSLYPSMDVGSHILTPHQFRDLNSSGSSISSDDLRKKRSRVFIDPLSEIPKLEKWFTEDTHPSSYMIEKYTEELNRSEYRQRFPKLEPKNVQLWFKNHRAKVKRTRLETSSSMMIQSPGSLSGSPLNNNTSMTNNNNNEDLKEATMCS